VRALSSPECSVSPLYYKLKGFSSLIVIIILKKHIKPEASSDVMLLCRLILDLSLKVLFSTTNAFLKNVAISPVSDF